MRNLRLLHHRHYDGVAGPGRCKLAQDIAKNVVLVCGRTLFRLEESSEQGTSPRWLKLGEIFDFEDDEVISLDATFSGFCAVSQRGQIVRFWSIVQMIDALSSTDDRTLSTYVLSMLIDRKFLSTFPGHFQAVRRSRNGNCR